MTVPFSPPLTDAELHFLSRWAYDEWHFTHGQGPAKKLELRHGVKPSEVAEILGAAFPTSALMEITENAPPDIPVFWPWPTTEDFRLRLMQARESNRRNLSGDYGS